MGVHYEADEVYDKYMKAVKRRKIISTIVIICVLLIVLALAALIWIVFNPEAFDKLTGKAKKDKKPVEYSDIEFTTHDITGMEFALGGKVLTFPCSIGELAEAGYILDKKDGSQLLNAANDMFYSTFLCRAEAEKFNSSLSLSVANLDTSPTYAKDCVIKSISVDDEHFMLCNGISFASSFDEVISTMGKPDEYDEQGYSKNLEYYYMTDTGEVEVYISFSSSSGTEKMKTLMLIDKSY